ncbi:MAG TPA: alpha/beta hydrolase [Burkholderiaceae bacterium]|nr:alpha/beta hydrolase [Burkholderiaceae bacterium]
MPAVQPFVREAGAGPGVVCLHSNASSSAQWRGLTDALSPTRRVLAPDCCGAGKSPQWPHERKMLLEDEVAFLEPVFSRAGDGFAVVGHSYGGAVALKTALVHRSRVTALALYEPTLFSLVEALGPSPNGVDGIRHTVDASLASLTRQDRDQAAAHFIDFWMGPGSWAATPPQRKPAIADAMINVGHWAHALFNEPAPLEAFAQLDIPVLLMTGEHSPESAQSVARLLAPVLPRVTTVKFAALGHMGPITDPDTVNAAIVGFFGET